MKEEIALRKVKIFHGAGEDVAYVFLPSAFANKNYCEMRFLRNEKGEIVSIILNKI